MRIKYFNSICFSHRIKKDQLNLVDLSGVLDLYILLSFSLFDFH
ncbi:hypothetical protein HNQ88_002462 [Aureibacter tunicatorum]|uniref:Uncharacterized protein n=1 Tax=Aureibacter tunicatorum TaxID=866807 RepID=A0AAE4BSZ4_9BACT|nr:hypothetical protein [Aureibacter tunicatorum]BDD04652.1 hypothetical protein AUTU_21350 [Aureibacter tunicatorum]